MGYLADGARQALHLLAGMDEAVFSAMRATLASSFAAVALALVIGLPAGYALGQGRFPGRKFLRLCSDTLLAFPTVLIGLVGYALLTRRGPFGSFGLLFTLRALIIGQTVLAVPIIISWTAQALEGADARVRLTLLTLGAGPLQLALASLWQARLALGMAAATAFGRVVTEVGVAMMLGGNIRYETRTMTTAIALETGKGEFAQGIALGLVLLAIAFVVNAVLAALKGRARP